MVSRHTKDLLRPKDTDNLPSKATINNNRCRTSNILLKAAIRPSKATVSSRHLISMAARLHRVSTELHHRKDSMVHLLHRDSMGLLRPKASMAPRLRKASTEHHHRKANMVNLRRKANMVNHLLKVNMAHLKANTELPHPSKGSTVPLHLKDSMEHRHRKGSTVHHLHKVNTAHHRQASIKLHLQVAVLVAHRRNHRSDMVLSEQPTST